MAFELSTGTAAGAMDGTEALPVLQSGNARKGTVGQILDYVLSASVWTADAAGAVARSLADLFEDRLSVMHFIPFTERVKVRLHTSTAPLNTYFQAACDTGRDFIVPYGKYCLTLGDGINPSSNQKITVDKGAIIKGLPSDLALHYLFRANAIDNFGFEGGILEGDLHEHTAAGSGYAVGDLVDCVATSGAGTPIRIEVEAVTDSGGIRKFKMITPGTGWQWGNYLGGTNASDTFEFVAHTGVGSGGGGIVFPVGKSWEVNSNYYKGHVFVFDGTTVYRCEVSHVSTVFADDLAAGYWVSLGTGVLNSGKYSVAHPYLGESGMGLALYDCTNFTIRDVVARYWWGDGIYIGGTGTNQCAEFLVDNCLSEDNRRQGMSIVAARDGRVRGGIFRRSLGAAPESGIDIEPTPGKGSIQNILVDGATVTENFGDGIAVSQKVTSDVTLEDLFAQGNTHCGANLGLLGDNVAVVRGKYIENGWHGISVLGSGAYVQMNTSIAHAFVHKNGRSGIKVGRNLMRVSVAFNMVSGNGHHGIDADGAGGSYIDDVDIAHNHSWNNSQAADNTYDNIYIGASAHNVSANFNWVRKQAPYLIDAAVGSGAPQYETNRPRYGINFTTSHTKQAFLNDVTDGGQTANINGAGNPDIAFRGNIGFKTENRVLSPEFAVDAVASVTVIIPHGCAYTPSTHHIQLTIVDTSATGFDGVAKIQSVDATNVTARVRVATAAASAGAKARLAMSVERPFST